MIKIFVIVIAVSTAGILAQNENPVPEEEMPEPAGIVQPMPSQSKKPVFYYHQDVGIPLAKQVYEVEMAMKMNRVNTKDNIQERIVNGVKSKLGEQPYHVGYVIHFKNGYISICGGSMLSNTKTVTAAHCWSDGKDTAALFELVFGSITIYFGGHRTNTSNVVTHQHFNHGSLKNDIAMITHKFVGYTKNIKKVALPVGNQTFAGSWAIATGFGRTHNLNDSRGNDDYYQPKRYVKTKVISDQECRRFLRIHLGENICTRGVKGSGIGTCQGDSGGPLTSIQNFSTVLIGITSFGAYLCDQPPYADAYTRVTYYLPWIKSRL